MDPLPSPSLPPSRLLCPRPPQTSPHRRVRQGQQRCVHGRGTHAQPRADVLLEHVAKVAREAYSRDVHPSQAGPAALLPQLGHRLQRLLERVLSIVPHQQPRRHVTQRLQLLQRRLWPLGPAGRHLLQAVWVLQADARQHPQRCACVERSERGCCATAATCCARASQEGSTALRVLEVEVCPPGALRGALEQRPAFPACVCVPPTAAVFFKWPAQPLPFLPYHGVAGILPCPAAAAPGSRQVVPCCFQLNDLNAPNAPPCACVLPPQRVSRQPHAAPSPSPATHSAAPPPPCPSYPPSALASVRWRDQPPWSRLQPRRPQHPQPHPRPPRRPPSTCAATQSPGRARPCCRPWWPRPSATTYGATIRRSTASSRSQRICLGTKPGCSARQVCRCCATGREDLP